jgi:hypothetical protein
MRKVMTKATMEDLNVALEGIYKALHRFRSVMSRSECLTSYGRVHCSELYEINLDAADRLQGWLVSVQQHRDSHILHWPATTSLVEESDDGA